MNGFRSIGGFAYRRIGRTCPARERERSRKGLVWSARGQEDEGAHLTKLLMHTEMISWQRALIELCAQRRGGGELGGNGGCAGFSLVTLFEQVRLLRSLIFAPFCTWSALIDGSSSVGYFRGMAQIHCSRNERRRNEEVREKLPNLMLGRVL